VKHCISTIGIVWSCVACCLAANVACAQSEVRQPATHALKLRVIEGEWGGSQLQDIQKTCQSAGMELWKHFPGRKLHPIIIGRSRNGPITWYDRLPSGEYQIRLDSQSNLWAQFSFQFAHELCHVLCCYSDDKHPNKWFEESLCEVASLFVMRRMAETWKTSPPYANWKGYSPHLKEYADDRIEKVHLPPDTSLAEWYAENAKKMNEEGSQRDKQRIVAAALLPLLEAEPSHWEAVGYLNAGNRFPNQSFADYLADWEYFAPAQHKPFVRKIVAMFGLAP